MYRNFIKPIADFFISLLLLVCFSPVIILTMLFLCFNNKGDIFFFQQRPGYKGKPFLIIKFKTMVDAYDKEGNVLPDEQRITKVGKLVRSASLDELLQLVNVLKGEMSLVGPRPLLMQYMSRYSPEQAKRHNVKPGITGWAQVNGRNAISWDQKFKFDIQYVERQSFLLDIKIIYMTCVNVLRRKDINAANHATMEEFLG